MAQTCARCSRPNPDEAIYCYHDGSLLQGRAAGAALNPGTQPFPGPFVFPSGRSCGNFDQLALCCQEEWAGARDLLQQGFLERFLGGLGRADLALAARSATAFPDRDRGLDQLLAALPSQVVKPPKLRAEPQALSLGVLRPGKDHNFELHLHNQGMRLLYGSVVSTSDWLTLGEAPGTPQKLFQIRDEGVVHVHVRGEHLRAGPKAQEALLTVESNGGTVEVKVKVDVPVTPFAEGVLAGATTPREIAVKAKQAPKEAAELFEKGLVARWYKVNGWTYPVAGESASGVAAVQQFFEALGLVKPPKVEITHQEVKLKGKVGERVEQVFQVLTREKRPLYAHAVSNQAWLSVSSDYANSTTARIKLIATVPPQPQEVMQARVTVTSNGNQRFVVPVTLAVTGSTRNRGAAAAVVVDNLEVVEELAVLEEKPGRAVMADEPVMAVVMDEPVMAVATEEVVTAMTDEEPVRAQGKPQPAGGAFDFDDGPAGDYEPRRSRSRRGSSGMMWLLLGGGLALLLVLVLVGVLVVLLLMRSRSGTQKAEGPAPSTVAVTVAIAPRPEESRAPSGLLLDIARARLSNNRYSSSGERRLEEP